MKYLCPNCHEEVKDSFLTDHVCPPPLAAEVAIQQPGQIVQISGAGTLNLAPLSVTTSPNWYSMSCQQCLQKDQDLKAAQEVINALYKDVQILRAKLESYDRNEKSAEKVLLCANSMAQSKS